MTDQEWETALAKARAFGVESGKAAGSWMLDGNSSEILSAFEEGYSEGFWDEVCRSARAMGAHLHVVPSIGIGASIETDHAEWSRGKTPCILCGRYSA